MADESFPKEKRLLKRWEFDRVFDSGSVSSDEHLVVYSAEGLTDRTRLGIVVGNSVSKATRRNRLNRVIRAGFRVAYSDLPEGIDMIVIPKNHDTLSGDQVKKSLIKLLSEE